MQTEYEVFANYRLLSKHSVPMVTHHIGGRVLTIEVSTHPDVGDMNVHCTAIFGKPRQEQYTQVVDIFH